jgi:hypothetical protein
MSKKESQARKDRLMNPTSQPGFKLPYKPAHVPEGFFDKVFAKQV